MINIPKPTDPKPPKSPDSMVAAYFYAAILTILALSQLFGFDEFVPLIGSFGMPGGEVLARFTAGSLVVCEVFALPFLLGMRLSILARTVSMVLGWIAPFGWLAIALWLNLTANGVTNIGIFGTKVELLPGWWAITFSLALLMLAAWSAWGLWPSLNSEKYKFKQ